MALLFFKKIRTFSWTASAFGKRYGKIIIFSLITGLFIFFLISRLLPFLPKMKKEERIGLVGQYNFDNLPGQILNLLGKGLTSVSQDGSVLPGLASEWQISDNALTYTFKLKKNIFWQDDKKIKASDIVYNFKDVDQEIVDEETLKFKLKEPFSPFLIAVSHPIFKKQLIGSGPYRIIRIKKKGQKLSLIELRGPKNIIFRFYPTISEVKLAFKLGKIDEIRDLLKNDFSSTWKNYMKIQSQVKKDYYLALFLNNKDSLLGSKDLRQALSYAIYYKETKDRVYSPINPDSWAYNSKVKVYNYDPKKAKKLFNKFNKDKKEKIQLKILTSEAFLNLAEDIKNSWHKTLGIETQIEVINFLPDDYQVFLGIQKIPVDPDQYFLWHSTRLTNITHFKDVSVDKLLEDGRKINDQDERKLKYFNFQKFLTEEEPIIFLYHPRLFTIKRLGLAF